MTISNRLKFEDGLKPICAVCRKEVESMKVMKDGHPINAHHDGRNIILVYCHGKRREMRMTDNIYYSGHLHRGIAFLDEIFSDRIEGTIQEIMQLEYQKKIEDK